MCKNTITCIKVGYKDFPKLCLIQGKKGLNKISFVKLKLKIRYETIYVPLFPKTRFKTLIILVIIRTKLANKSKILLFKYPILLKLCQKVTNMKIGIEMHFSGYWPRNS